MIVDVEINVIRHSPLAGPIEWADGDFTAVLSDGTRRSATLYEKLISSGLPEEWCKRQAGRAIKLPKDDAEASK